MPRFTTQAILGFARHMANDRKGEAETLTPEQQRAVCRLLLKRQKELDKLIEDIGPGHPTD